MCWIQVTTYICSLPFFRVLKVTPLGNMIGSLRVYLMVFNDKNEVLAPTLLKANILSLKLITSSDWFQSVRKTRSRKIRHIISLIIYFRSFAYLINKKIINHEKKFKTNKNTIIFTNRFELFISKLNIQKKITMLHKYIANQALAYALKEYKICPDGVVFLTMACITLSMLRYTIQK